MSNEKSQAAAQSKLSWPWSKKTVEGKLYPTQPLTNISDFVDPGTTPGNVGVCFSGGGSVAMISALGQMRALNEMGFLGKARAISTVSGGSWALIPFTYLPDNIDDATFLGAFNDNPASLTIEALKNIPKGYLGAAVAADSIKWTNMAALAAELLVNPLFPNDRIWNYLIAKNILAPFGLSSVKLGFIEKSWFAYDEADADQIKKENDDMPDKYYTYQQSEGRTNRPFHLCNTSMFITPNENANQGNMLASIQSTAKGTGIFSTNLGVPDAKNQKDTQQVGGGLVSSYAFNSQLDKVKGNDVKVKRREKESFSLADITANSSAFFATALPKMGNLIDPQYNYWPVQNANPENPGVESKFADGGAIEDNGILNMLAYNDIDSIVSFVNALGTVFIDPNNPEKGKNIVIDSWLPTLFGYTPYQKDGAKSGLSIGYHLYSGLKDKNLTDENIRYYKHNQVFDSSLFFPFIQELYKNINNYDAPAAYYNEAIEVMDNEWFNIKGRTIKLLIVHYGPFSPFVDALQDDVKKVLMDYVNNTQKQRHKQPKFYPPIPTDGMFPNFMLTATHMPAEIVNIFAHFTSNIAYTQQDILNDMFKDNSVNLKMK